MLSFAKEAELRNHIIENFDTYFDFEFVQSEFRINKSRIDILGQDKETVYLIEIKRDAINLQTIEQLSSYIELAKQNFPSKKIKGIAIAPNIANEVYKDLYQNKIPQEIEIKAIDNVEYNHKTQALMLDEKMIKEIKRKCIDEDTTFQDAVKIALKEWLKK